MAPRAVEHANEQNTTVGTAMKRRGLIAGAAALMAGIVAKQTSQPVAASPTGMVYEPNPLLSQQLMSAGRTVRLSGNASFADTSIFDITAVGSPDGTAGVRGFASGHADGVVGTGTSGSGVSGTSDSWRGVFGTSTSDDGVLGTSASGIGVVGICSLGIGVYGRSSGDHAIYGELLNATSGKAAVSGNGNGGGTFGVLGDGVSGSGVGVQGQSNAATGTGVKGVSTAGFPVIGVASGVANANAGVLGVGKAGPGMQGQSTGSHGLVGTTSATDGNHAGLIGTVQPGGNAIGLRGSVAAGAVGYAGVFDGDVIINGALRVFGSPKNAAVKHPGDGTYRLLYCMESPESWFEDFGEGRIVGGTGEVKLDGDFATFVHTDAYHVFLTPKGDCNGLYVADQTPAGFSVHEMKGGANSLPFSYRVVAKRKDIVGERLAKVAPPPPLKPVTPFTVPATPEVKPPARKPVADENEMTAMTNPSLPVLP